MSDRMPPATAHALLMRCVRSGNAAGAQAAIDRGANVNAPDAFGVLPLSAAVQRNDQVLISCLARHGASPIALSTGDTWPMLMAVLSGNTNAVIALAIHCADFRSPLASEPSVLESALTAGHYGLASYLARHGADIECVGALGETALMRFIAMRNEEAAYLLLHEGALWFHESDSGSTAYDLAKATGQVKLAHAIRLTAQDQPLVGRKLAAFDRMWVRSGTSLSPHGESSFWADFEPEAVPSYGLASSARWPTAFLRLSRALHQAARATASGLARSGRALMRVNQLAGQALRDSLPARSQRLRATSQFITKLKSADLAGATTLLASGKVLVNARDATGCPVLVLAARAAGKAEHRDPSCSALELSEQLLLSMINRGAKVRSYDAITCNNLVHELGGLGQQPLLERLLKAGVLDDAVNRSNAQLMRPLHLACDGEHMSAVQQLFHRGADLNPVNRYGLSPLHRAALRAQRPVIEALINRGVNLGQRTGNGRTADEMLRAIGTNATAIADLLTNRVSFERAMSIFSPGNPIASAVKARVARSKSGK